MLKISSPQLSQQVKQRQSQFGGPVTYRQDAAGMAGEVDYFSPII